MTGRSRPEQHIGQITNGINENTLVLQVFAFIERQLPEWRDDPSRPPVDSEPRLNAQLCHFLNSRARSNFPMMQFMHEEPQQGHRQVDLSASLTESRLIGACQYSIYDPLLLLEGKRLPAPSRGREREYVTGLNEKSGGIQRFKLGLYAANQKVAGIIGYIQGETAQHWHTTINSWIEQLSRNPGQDVCRWSARDKLNTLENDPRNGVATCSSRHKRSGSTITATIELHHLWVNM